MSKNEKSILNGVLLALGAAGLRVWRNNTGQAWMGRAVRLKRGQKFTAQDGDVLIKGARVVKFGLVGSGDIIGLQQVTITSDMVGKTIGQFVSVETKTLTGRQTEQQENFQKMVRELGGKCEVARSPEAAIAKILGNTDG